MAKKKGINVSNKNLGIALIVGLIIQYVLPAIKLSAFSWLGTLIYLIVAILLLIK